MQKNETGTRKWILPLLLVMVLISFLIIAVSVTALKIATFRLGSIASAIEETAEQHITAEVTLDQHLPLNSNFEVAGDVTVGIDMAC